MRILIAGSSGFIGSHLIPFLEKNGHEVVKLSHDRSKSSHNKAPVIYWNPESNLLDSSSLEGFDVVINLAGENISNGRWTARKKQRISDSRINSTRLLCNKISELKKPPHTLINASAIGYYGDRGAQRIDEKSTKGHGFLADVCAEWEDATQQAQQKGIRVVLSRFGVVLDPSGGALKQMLMPFKFGLGGQIGSGDQFMSWIAMEDVLGIFQFILMNESLQGPINLVSPNPVTNKEFTKTLGNAVTRPTFMWMPDFIAKIIFGEMGEALLLSSTRAIPHVLNVNGYNFLYSNLDSYLKEKCN